ncbi:hemolysin family protein [Halorubrum sp. CSM-61]|uniref:hemolysin family protein n=1 Tax=Halorubrum sp. CSM-61 TaxID=2485838 RepID=UPI000F4D17CF|nr:hemolysin family protein [Halorubrum sp. CSM-61]
MGLWSTTLTTGVPQLPAMDDPIVTVLGVLTIIVLLAMSAFFSSSEIAMFSLPKHRIESLVEEGVGSAETIEGLKQNPHRLLVTILVGNNLVNIGITAIATTLIGVYVESAVVTILLTTFGITAIVLLFAETAPKSYAVENTESWALRIARPLKLSEGVLYPLVVVFDYLTRAVNKVTGGRAAIESTYVTREEIQNIIETGEREGVIEEEEREMLDRIFRFNNTIAKEVMTPRLDVTAVAKESSVEEAIEKCIQADHERVPVYEGNLDNIIGVVTVRDLVRELRYSEGEPSLERVVKPTLHVPESKNADELLAEMQDNRLQMVTVIDEFGTTEGIITLEDMVEEIVGEILEGDEEAPVEFLEDNVAVVQGEVNIDEVNEILGIDLPEGEEFETLAGFVFNRAGRLVEEGEEIEFDGVRIRIERVDNTRIMSARVTVLDAAEAAKSMSEDEAVESGGEPEAAPNDAE